MHSLLLVQKPDMAGLAEFLKPLNEVIMKANAMTEGRRSDFLNHLKSAGDSLSALAWIAYTGKDCGMWMYVVAYLYMAMWSDSHVGCGIS